MLDLATPDDHAAIVTLVNHAYRGGGEKDSWNTESGVLSGARITLEQLRHDLEITPDARILVHRAAGNALRGSVWLQPLDADEWYLGMLAIDPTAQALGVGRGMLAAIEAYVADQGGQRIRMTVLNVRETLITWYERRGYGRTGETEAFPYGDNRFGTPLRDDLVFVVLGKAL